MEKKITTKSTKNEIFDAYNTLLEKMKTSKEEEPKKIQEKQKQEETVKQASSFSYEGIVKGIANLKMDLSTSLDKLSDSFVGEFKKFEELQKAINIEKRNIEELYQVSASSDSLAVMLMAQKEKREEFEAEMKEKKENLEVDIKQKRENFELQMEETRANWKKEKLLYEQKLKEEKEDLIKKRAREEEEYEYQLATNRKKETDNYEEQKTKLEKEIKEKKAIFEKEIAEREEKVNFAEAELKELRKKNDNFPKELDAAVKNAIEQTNEKMELNYKFEKEITQKQTEGELKLKDQIIDTLNSKIKDMEATIKELSQKANIAESSVKDIAIKAIESSSNVKIIDKKIETEKE